MTPRLHPRPAMRVTLLARSVVVLAICSACGREHGMKGEPSSGPTANAKLVSAAKAAEPRVAIGIANDEADDGQWSRPAKDYASSRYSKLAQINSARGHTANTPTDWRINSMGSRPVSATRPAKTET